MNYLSSLGFFCTAVLLSGCVSKTTFEEKENELATCRKELTQCRTQVHDQNEKIEQLQSANASLRQELDSTRKDMEAYRGKSHSELISCVDNRHKLETDLEVIRQLHASCTKELDAKQTNLQELEAKTARFRDKLQTEIADRNVEIEQLRGQLSVRVLDKILFKSGSTDILPEGLAVLGKLATLLAAENDNIRVEGHTDTVPIGPQLREKYPSNWELSAARASSVVRYFEHAHKIDSTRMEAVGFSQYHPIAIGTAPEELKRNRRVEIVLTAAKAN